MNKGVRVIIFVILFCIVSVGAYRLLDLDTSLKLPFSQTVQSFQYKSVLGSTHLDISHVVVIVMENKSSGDIIGNSNAPFINSLLQKYSFADNYFAVAHPSLPNYVAILGGDTFGIQSDCTDCFIASRNLIDQLEVVHKTWKAYMESMPTSCFTGSMDEYAQKHNPFIYFDTIRNNVYRCQKIVPFANFQKDLQSENSTPNFVWITPNLCHDMHDCSVDSGDTWLSSEVPRILNSPAFTKQKSLLVITWDEGENSSNNKIPTLFIGNTVKKGYVSHVLYTHYSLLHTIEDVWNIPPETKNVSQSAVITDIFSSTL